MVTWVLNFQNYLAQTFVSIVGTTELAALLIFVCFALILFSLGLPTDFKITALLALAIIMVMPPALGGLGLFLVVAQVPVLIYTVAAIILGVALWRMFNF